MNTKIYFAISAMLFMFSQSALAGRLPTEGWKIFDEEDKTFSEMIDNNIVTAGVVKGSEMWEFSIVIDMQQAKV
ncbi:MAG: hypothetical protein HQL31_09715, partial [Planctomycetes bacterium]|nr:hypothetical protein [Planctomycetota bacterium]